MRGASGRTFASAAVGIIVLIAVCGATTPASAATTARPVAGGSQAVAPPGFVPTTPQRVVDTRIGQGGVGPIAAGQTLTVPMPPTVPVDAVGVALTVTADQGSVEGFVTAYPCAGSRPVASLLNPQQLEPRANQLLLALDSSREACLFTNTTAQLVVDLTGWLSPTGQQLHPVTQFRALDTRFGPRPDGGTGKPAAKSVIQLPLAGHGSVPADATAVSANITLTNAEGPGYVTAYPCGTPTPDTSTGNVPDGGTRASFTFVGLGGGSLCLFVLHADDVVVDITGYFAPGAGDGVFPQTPRRLLDTRTDSAGAIRAGETRIVRLGLPTGTDVAELNVTAVNADAQGWVRLAPCGPNPGTSAINYEANAAIANLAMTSVGGEDSVCLTSNVTTHVIVDLAAAATRGTVAAFQVSGAPMFPAFRPDVPDYVVFCADGPNPLSLHLAGETGATVSLDGGAVLPALDATFSLLSGQAFSVSFTGPGGNGVYRVRCLPPDFPQFSSRRYGQSKAAYYLVTPPMDTGGSYVALFDHEGVPVWWKRQDTPTADAKVLQSPTRIVWSTTNAGVAFNSDPSVDYKVHALDGTQVGEIAAVGTPTDFHDMAVLANGNHIVTSYIPRLHVDLSSIGQGTDQLVLDAHIQEVTPGGVLVWEWHSEDHTAPNETLEIGRFPYPGLGNALDLLHVNAISEDGPNGIIVSARHMDAVLRIDKPTGKITWKLGGAPNAGAGVKNLTLVNDPQHGPKLQHDARLLPDGTLTMFDNRNFGFFQARAIRYQLNLAAGTATLIEQVVNDEEGLSFFQGSARRTTAGTWVVNWGGSTVTTEQDALGTKLFQLTFATAVSYRGIPVETGVLDRDALAAGMNTQFPR